MQRRPDSSDLLGRAFETAPVPMSILSAAGDVTHRNAAAIAFVDTLVAERGSQVTDALRNGLRAAAREGRSFPYRKLVSVEIAGRHGVVEFLLARLGDGFVATYSDVTAREDSRELMTRTGRELTETSRSLAELGEQLTRDTDAMAQRTDAVASGATEINASISEIARTATSAAASTGTAVESAQLARTQVARLNDASEKIGNATTIIRSIAEQTNLLALNATIEAARAGDAGKGFAVVAGEVKDLSHRTATATSDIAGMITEIQSSSEAATQAIGSILDLIGQIEGQQSTIAAAVEEQTIATNDMSRGINDAAAASQSLAAAVATLRETAALVAEQARQVTAMI